jgi:hypothetical protein
MERDLELIRIILLTVKEGKRPQSIMGESSERIGSHVQFLLEEGYIEGSAVWVGLGEDRSPVTYFVKRITTAGRNYLD